MVHTVLGLSLKSDDVAWVLVDSTDGTVLDHDALELPADVEIAGRAARSAQAIARACGFEVDRVRLTSTNDVALDALGLPTRLRNLGFGDVETVPVACARAVLVDAEATGITPRLALAYGAARAIVDPSEPMTVSAMQQNRGSDRQARQRIVSAALGVAAAAILGLVFLSAGAAPQLERPATAAVASVPPDAGWAAIPAPSDVASTLARKVVATPSHPEQPAPVVSAPVVSAPVVSEPAVSAPVVSVSDEPAHAVPLRAVDTTALEPTSAPTEVPHLSGASPGAGPVSALTDPTAVPAPGPEIAEEPGPDFTEVVNALSALP